MAITIALAGNPNSGKTTLFNALTGANQYVGNWPGVTVEKKEGKLKGHKDITIEDLPGIYSLSPYTLEEVVSRKYLIEEQPNAIINIVDGTNLERNLYLSTQVLELGIPVIMAVNMADVTAKNGDVINLEKLSEKLGVTVVGISALKGTGVDELVKKAVKLANENNNFTVKHAFSEKVENVISAVSAKLPAEVSDAQKRFFAIKLIERDNKIGEQLSNVPDVSAEIAELEKEFDDDTESIITNERYNYITSMIGDCYTKKNKSKLSASDKIDKIVTNRILALPIFAAIMILVYWISVTTVGTFATDWANDGLFGDGFHLFAIGDNSYADAVDEYYAENVFTDEVTALVDAAVEAGMTGAEDMQAAIEDGDSGAFDEAYGFYSVKYDEDEYAEYDIRDIVDAAVEADDFPDPADYGVWVPGVPVLVENLLDVLHCNDFVKSLILDGIVGGVGAVLGFVPQMIILFIFLAFLEECGYMARVAFIMDRIFRRFGLSGKSFIPILIGTGCGVPGVMASRTIEADRDRKMTIITTTFIPCGAKLPIIALIAAAVFSNAWWVGPSAYFLGIAAIILSGIMLKKTKVFAGDPAPFVMELPAYHMPTIGSVLRSMWERSWSFIKKAGTIILLSSIVIWLGSTFGWTDGKFGWNPDIELADSVLGTIGNVVKVIFVPLGFGSGTAGIQATIATVMGLVAKEEVVGVFGVLDFEGLGKIAGYSFLAFNLLCAPCFAAMGAIKREMNNIKWFWIAVGYQCVFAYIVALIIYGLGGLFTASFNGAEYIISVLAILFVALIVYLLVRPNKYSDDKLEANVKVK